jgi:hypothetical protein
MALSGQTNRARVCPLLDNSGQGWILAGNGLSANDPKQTFSRYANPMSSGLPRSENVLDFRFVPIGWWVLAPFHPRGPF